MIHNEPKIKVALLQSALKPPEAYRFFFRCPAATPLAAAFRPRRKRTSRSP